MSAYGPPRVYLDANVVIGWINEEAEAVRLLQRLVAQRAYLLSSHFLRLEVEPQHGPGMTAIRRFRTRTFFGATRKTVAPSTRLVERAIDLRGRHALGAMDALHLAVAEIATADVFITAEDRRKPMHKVKLGRTRVLTPAAFLRETR